MMYLAINEVLEQLDADLGAAEAHGMAVGMLSVESSADAANWLRELYKDDSDIPESGETLLRDLFEKTRRELDYGIEEFSFDLFLPEDDELLSERVEALRDWCQGFLFGIGYLHASGDWPGDVGEIMRDIIEFTKIDSDSEDDNEEEANALMEVHEYIRAAVFTVRDYFLESRDNYSH